MKRLIRWIPTLVLVISLAPMGACGEEKSGGAAGEDQAENSDAAPVDESDAAEEPAKPDEAKAEEAKAGDTPADSAKPEAGAEVAKSADAKDAPAGEETVKAGAEGAAKEAAAAPAENPEEAKLKAMGPEEEAAMKKRCGEAFDNTVAIMQTAGAPPQIVTQMRGQRDNTVASCLEQAKLDPAGTRMLDCMLAARVPADIQTCTRKFGNIKPVKAPEGGHGH